MTEIKGPFGLWGFPLLNMLVQMLGSRGTGLPRTGFPQPRVVERAKLTEKVTQNNEESWELVRDANGRLANVVVHRKVTQNEHDEGST